MRWHSIALIVGTLLLPNRAAAQELVTGWEGGPSNGYAFVEPMLSTPKTGTTSAFVVRPTAGYLYYNFRQNGATTSVTSPGAALGVAYRYRAPHVTFTVGPGVEVRWEHRTYSTGGFRDERTVGGTIAADAFVQVNPLTTVSAITSYGSTNHYLWVRGGVKRQLTNRHFKGAQAVSVGVEGTGQGNHDVRQVQIGGFVELVLLRAHASVQVRGGFGQLRFADTSMESRPYFGVGLYRSF